MENPMINLRQHLMIRRLPFLIALALLWTTAPATSRAESPGSADYLTEVKPLLQAKCYSCHSALKQEGGLRLDAARLIRKGGDSGPAYLLDPVEQSLILERVTDADDNRMPPEGEGAKLTADEVAVLTRWIRSGAKAPEEIIPVPPEEHWSFLPPTRPTVPDASADWIRNDIDRFLVAEQLRMGVTAVGEVSRSMLLRRASLALTGLPPTPEERRAFLDDSSDAKLEKAFEKAVDRMLASPRYGERWARHMMDIWRYSDPSGYGKEIRDGREHIWRWRDWIVDSLNDDKGYDRMVVEMLAADEIAPEDQASLRATGFLARNWYKFNRNVWLDNIVEHSSKAFLGLTINCARCHAHKYDPFEQHSYYQMRAIFETHDVRDDAVAAVGSKSPSTASAQGMLVRAYDAHLERTTFPFLQGDENRPDESTPLSAGLPQLLGELSIEPVTLPVTAWYPALQKANREASVRDAEAKVAAAEKAIETARAAVATAQKSLDDFRDPPAVASTTAKPASEPNDADDSPTGKPVLADDFAQLDLDQWTVEGGNWTAKDGRLVQSQGETQQHRLVSAMQHPHDFRALLRLRITGGEQYRSVGLGFDGHGMAMNSVYLSVSGPKVQFSHQGADGRWQYPAQGMAAHPIRVNQDYELELLVKDRLLNVLIDGQLKVSYSLPPRKPGRLSIWTFSATAEFDQLRVTTLAPIAKLAPPQAAAASQTAATPATRESLQSLLRIAQAQERAAVARHRAAKSQVASLIARAQAELVKYGLLKGEAGEGGVDAVDAAAGRASRQHDMHKLEEEVAAATVKLEQAKAKAGEAKAAKMLQDATKQVNELTKRLVAAQQPLESNSTDYPPLGKQYPKTSSGRRLAFAKWITDRKNPLAARVIVNHVWLRHFDVPLVERTFDFGLRSEPPRHLELLDWLAVQFMEDGWSLKKLHKQILMSGVYRRNSSMGASSASLASKEADPDNLTLWHMNARRMEAEVVRDSVLYLGGSLDMTTGGPPIEHTQGQTVLRRSLYFRQDKERQMTFLSLFDGAKVNECYERKTTVAPQQALAMFNSPIASQQARKIAAAYASVDGAALVDALFEHVLCREPTTPERAECVQFLNTFQSNAESRRQLALVLLNHNDFVTIR